MSMLQMYRATIKARSEQSAQYRQEDLNFLFHIFKAQPDYIRYAMRLRCSNY